MRYLPASAKKGIAKHHKSSGCKSPSNTEYEKENSLPKARP